MRVRVRLRCCSAHARLVSVARFASPFIHDILSAYQLHLHNARKTVAYLQRSFPQLPTESAPRFADLSESTIRSWHDADGKLLPRFMQLLEEEKSAAPRGPGRQRMLEGYPGIEAEVKRILLTMRDRGAVVSLLVVQHILRIVIENKEPTLLAELKLSKHFSSVWVREALGWSWRMRTTAASKLPLDWRAQGVQMAKRIAFNIQVHKVHPSLVVNMDQTGILLAPADCRTYETKGSKAVKVIGADDKRQITACIASSLSGDLLPLQLIFQGKTDQCHPPLTEEARSAFVHLTHSENHWSNQTTMQEYICKVLIPYAERRMHEHNLPRDSHIVLVLDVWAVHKSEEFRRFIRTNHPQIHLVFIPANCTSQLQVADVMLQRPFKHGVRQRFNTWAADILREQVNTGELVGLAPYLKMSSIKPLLLQWLVESWKKMSEGRDYIKFGWHTCCVSLFDVHDAVKRIEVLESVAKGELDANGFVPEGTEDEEKGEESDHEEDEERDELDVMKERRFGTRKSIRKRTQPTLLGYQFSSSQIAVCTSDSD